MSPSNEAGTTGARLGSMDGKRWGRFVIGLVGAAVSIHYLQIAWDYGFGTRARPGPGLFPVAVGVGLLLTSLGVCIEAVAANARSAIAGTFDLPRGATLLKVVGVLAAIGAYTLLLVPLGSYVAAIILAVVISVCVTDRSWVRAGSYGAVVAIVVTAMFVELLGVRLPPGVTGVG